MLENLTSPYPHPTRWDQNLEVIILIMGRTLNHADRAQLTEEILSCLHTPVADF